MATSDDLRRLATLCERDEAGRHFTTLYPEEWLSRMEAEGMIRIERPIHEATGIPYSMDHWGVEVTEDGIEAAKARKED